MDNDKKRIIKNKSSPKNKENSTDKFFPKTDVIVLTSFTKLIDIDYLSGHSV